MKRIMTNEQIEELNELLVDHGDTLTAFYDEGRAEILSKCCVGALIAVPVVLAIDRGVSYISKRIKSRKIEEA